MNKSTKKDRNAKIIILVVTLALTILFATLAGVLPHGNDGGSNVGNYGSSSSNGGSSSSNGKTVSGTLTLNTTTTVRLSGTTYVYYRYSPTTSGTYVFTATSSYDTYAELYDSSWNRVTYDDDSGSGNDFRISQYLYSGSTYYIGVRMYSGSTSGTISLTVTR